MNDMEIFNRGNNFVLYNYINMKHLILDKEAYDIIQQYNSSGKEKKEYSYEYEYEDREYVNKLISLYEDFCSVEKENIEIESVYISITSRCNLKCIHCCESHTEEEEVLSDDFERTMRIINNISKIYPKKIIITGGEPMLNDRFYDIVTEAKVRNKNAKFVLSTNATMINNSNIDFITSIFESFDISLDGYDEISVSKIRGKGVYEKVIRSIELLHNKGIKNISLSMVFGEKNIDKINDFTDFCSKIGVEPIIRYFSPEGRGYTNYSEFSAIKSKLPLSICYMYKKYINEGVKIIADSCECEVYKDAIFIDSNGIAYPCTSLVKEEFAITDLSDKNFDLKIFFMIMREKRKKFMHNYIMHKKNKCQNCDVHVFCWKCPAMYYNALCSDEVDTWCTNMKESMNRVVWGESVE